MIKAKVLKKLIYKGKVYNVGEIFDCDANVIVGLERRGIVQRLLTPDVVDDVSEDNIENFVPVEGLPTLEEELKAKAKKK